MYPLQEVLLLVVCATCDDFDDIVALCFATPSYCKGGRNSVGYAKSPFINITLIRVLTYKNALAL
jgi:hypothetical protein